MFIEERHQAILKKLEEDNRVFTNELIEIYDVSIDTIRRDLTILEEKGLLKRTHGGAIPVIKVRERPTYKTVKDIGDGVKHYNTIAKKACEYISEGETIFIGGASLHYLMTKYLPLDINYTVVTNSIIVAEELRSNKNIDIFIVCGKMRASGIVVDSAATEFIRNMRLDINFTCGAGISADYGLSNSTYEAVSFGKQVSAISRRVICMAPREKLGYEAFIKVLDAQELDIVITDEEADKDEMSKLRDLGVEVVIV